MKHINLILIGLGLFIGIVLGMVFHNSPLWIPIGILFGVVLAVIRQRILDKNGDDED